MKNKKVESFLKEKGYIDHPEEKEKMILALDKKAGLIVFEHGSSFEFILGYLGEDICPELIFSDLTAKNLIDKFDCMQELAIDFCGKLLALKF